MGAESLPESLDNKYASKPLELIVQEDLGTL